MQWPHFFDIPCPSHSASIQLHLLQRPPHSASLCLPLVGAAAAQAAEDSDWAAAGEGAKSKAQAKKDAQAKEREQAAAKKAEAKQLAAQEEAELAATAKKANKKAAAPATKVTPAPSLSAFSTPETGDASLLVMEQCAALSRGSRASFRRHRAGHRVMAAAFQRWLATAYLHHTCPFLMKHNHAGLLYTPSSTQLLGLTPCTAPELHVPQSTAHPDTVQSMCSHFLCSL